MSLPGPVKSGIKSLSPRAENGSTLNRYCVVRQVFALPHRHDGIGHPAIAEFAFMLFGEHKQIGQLRTVFRSDLDSNLRMITFDPGSDDGRVKIVYHRRIGR